MIQQRIRQKTLLPQPPPPLSTSLPSNPMPPSSPLTPTLQDPQKWSLLSGSQHFVIRKQTILSSNQDLNKRLSKQYQASKIDFRKKSALLKDPKERVIYDYESYPEKKEMYVLREIFAKVSKSNELMKANHEEMKKTVERISKATQGEDVMCLKEAEIARCSLKLDREAERAMVQGVIGGRTSGGYPTMMVGNKRAVSPPPVPASMFQGSFFGLNPHPNR